MTDSIASLPSRPLPGPTPSDGVPGLEDDSVDTGQFWSTEEGPTFAEFLDIINPLQHIPIVSSVYRAITGDQIGTGPRFIGGILFGGPIGAIAAGVTSLFEEASGGDITSHVAELMDDVLGTDDEVVNSAANTPRDSGDRNRSPVAAAIPPQQAALAPEAGFNRITFNPAAALGVPQNSPANPPLGKPAERFSGYQPRSASAMSVPFADTSKADPRPAGNPDTSPMNASLARSRRQQADMMLAKWAAQQMAAQNRSEPPKRGDDAEEKRGQAAAHPMIPPRNASPEWYARAMDRALTQYNQAGMTGQLPPGGSGIPTRR